MEAKKTRTAFYHAAISISSLLPLCALAMKPSFQAPQSFNPETPLKMDTTRDGKAAINGSGKAENRFRLAREVFNKYEYWKAFELFHEGIAHGDPEDFDARLLRVELFSRFRSQAKEGIRVTSKSILEIIETGLKSTTDKKAKDKLTREKARVLLALGKSGTNITQNLDNSARLATEAADLETRFWASYEKIIWKTDRSQDKQTLATLKKIAPQLKHPLFLAYSSYVSASIGEQDSIKKLEGAWEVAHKSKDPELVVRILIQWIKKKQNLDQLVPRGSSLVEKIGDAQLAADFYRAVANANVKPGFYYRKLFEAGKALADAPEMILGLTGMAKAGILPERNFKESDRLCRESGNDYLRALNLLAAGEYGIDPEDAAEEVLLTVQEELRKKKDLIQFLPRIEARAHLIQAWYGTDAKENLSHLDQAWAVIPKDRPSYNGIRAKILAGFAENGRAPLENVRVADDLFQKEAKATGEALPAAYAFNLFKLVEQGDRPVESLDEVMEIDDQYGKTDLWDKAFQLKKQKATHL